MAELDQRSHPDGIVGRLAVIGLGLIGGSFAKGMRESGLCREVVGFDADPLARGLAVPMGVIAAFDPITARAIGEGMTRYLAALPEALYALFGTGYLGYTAARQWGKVKGVDQ